MSLHRRNLILGALAASWVPPPVFGRTDGKVFDLVVVGAGAAGLTAACLASECGLKRVLVLESEPLIGGSSIISGGFWAVSGTELQKKLGVADSDEAFFEDILTVGAHRNDEALVRAFIRENRRQYEWMLALGVAPQTLAPGSGTLRAHVFDARRLVERLYRRAVSSGVDIRVGTRVRDLEYDPRRGRVAGVRTDGASHAARAVLLASGGFSRNTRLLEQYSPRMRFVSTIAAQGSRGDGIVMARKLGAGLADMEWLEASYAFIRNPTTIRDMTFVNYHGGIIVNKFGRRFVDESLPYKLIAKEVLKQNDARSFIVFDERIRRISEQQPMDRRRWDRVPLASGRTLAEAANQCSIDPSALERTVDAYNAAVAGGEDAGRGPVAVNNGRLLVIDRPPFYVLPVSPCLLGTYCGVKINEQAQVVTEEGEAIPGLWAAGEVTGGFHGASFIMGTALGKAQTFARIAVRNIAAALAEA